MSRYRTHSIEFKRQVAQEYLSGETLHGLAKRHDITRNLIRVWVRKYEEGPFDDDAQAADIVQEYEARIAALERPVGKQALELEFLKGALKSAPPPRRGTTSVVIGPVASPSPKDAG
jgi:transposase-like protein